MINLLFTSIILGVAGGITPGVVMISAFSEILADKKKGLILSIKYLSISAATEFLIAIFLVTFYGFINIPKIIFSYSSIIGAVILLIISRRFFQFDYFVVKKKQTKMSLWEIFLYMFFNGPMWIFWITVCLPEAFLLGKHLFFGEYYFIIIFQLSMMFSMSIIISALYFSRNLFLNPKVINILFPAMGVLLGIISIKLIYSAVLEVINI